MDFGIKRLDFTQDVSSRYHLFDAANRLVMVADQGSPWLAADMRQYVRFARPDGKPIASLDLPWAVRGDDKKARQHTGYVVIAEHAVYAIINEYRQSANRTSKQARPYYIVEVEGEIWLALSQPETEPFYAIYNQVPAGLTTYEALTEADLPKPIGAIHQATGDYDFTVNLAPDRLQNTTLIALALVFLIDRAQQ